MTRWDSCRCLSFAVVVIVCVLMEKLLLLLLVSVLMEKVVVIVCLCVDGKVVCLFVCVLFAAPSPGIWLQATTIASPSSEMVS